MTQFVEKKNKKLCCEPLHDYVVYLSTEELAQSPKVFELMSHLRLMVVVALLPLLARSALETPVWTLNTGDSVEVCSRFRSMWFTEYAPESHRRCSAGARQLIDQRVGWRQRVELHGGPCAADVHRRC